jgi:hypothetical protein
MSSLSAPAVGGVSPVKPKVRARTTDNLPAAVMASSSAGPSQQHAQSAQSGGRTKMSAPVPAEEDEEEYGSEESYPEDDEEFTVQCDVMGQALSSALAEHFSYQNESGSLNAADIMLMLNENLGKLNKQFEQQNHLLNKILHVLAGGAVKSSGANKQG